MLLRSCALVSAVIFSASMASAADPGDALKSCAALTDGAARLACYDKLSAPAASVAAPAAVNTAVPVVPAAQTKPEQFGSEGLPMAAPVATDGSNAAAPAAPEALDSISDEVKTVQYNRLGSFTVTLRNGQVWQQLAGDSDKARFDAFDGNGDPTVVTVERGILGSYNLSVNGHGRVFKVKRVK